MKSTPWKLVQFEVVGSKEKKNHHKLKFEFVKKTLGD